VGEAYGHGGVEVLESWGDVGVGIGFAGGDACGAQGDEGCEEEEEFENVGVHCWVGWSRVGLEIDLVGLEELEGLEGLKKW
jgi:hypothetical protein